MTDVATSRLTLLVLAGDATGLAAMLAHHRALWDEAVVVDTGDGEVAAAAANAGARVASYRWDDDFAAARNAGLDAASGDWILVLDTDELIAPVDFPQLRIALREPAAIRIMKTVNYYPDARHPEWRPVEGRYPREEGGQIGYFLAQRAGLFPCRDDLRFAGRIHETVMPDAAKAGLPVRELEVPVHHYGYVQGDARNRERARRDATLVRSKHADDPHDAAACLELASVLIGEGDIDGARSLLGELVKRQPVDSAVTRGRFLLGRLWREEGRLDEAATLLQGAVADDPRLLFCWLEWIRTEADRGAWVTGLQIISRARQRFGTDPLLDREEMRCLIKTGRLADAAAVVERLRETQPGWSELAGLADRLRHLTGGDRSR